jgi:hypothetical protein
VVLCLPELDYRVFQVVLLSELLVEEMLQEEFLEESLLLSLPQGQEVLPLLQGLQDHLLYLTAQGGQILEQMEDPFC